MPRFSNKSKPSGEMFCSYCGQGFKRDEHLERHILTHTNIRPFRCRECKLAFKRKDLLRRHYRSIHAPPTEDENALNEDDTMAARPGAAGRIPIACANCAQSKTKCDNQIPCGRCVKKNLNCERRTFRRSSCKDGGKQSTIPRSDQKPLESGHHDETNELEDEGRPEKFEEVENDILSSPSQFTESMEIDMQGPNSLHLTTDMGLPIFYPSIPQATSYHDMDFSVFMDFGEPSTASNLTLLSATSDSTPTLSDSDWSVVHDDFQMMPHSAVPQPLPITSSPTSIPVMDSCQHWPFYQCNPGTVEGLVNASISNLSGLKVLDNPTIWLHCAPSLTTQQQSIAEHSAGLPHCVSSTRDRLLAVTQQIWRISKERMKPGRAAERQGDGPNAWMDRVILLPPTDVMHKILAKYISQESKQFHLLPTEEFTTSASLLRAENKLLSGILTLLIIAQVTRSSVIMEARALSNGLAEVCRIVLQDAEMAVNTEFLEASLSLLQLLHWSGEAAHMAASLKLWEQHAAHIQSTFLALSPVDETPLGGRQASDFPMEALDATDNQSRMLYSWIAVDLEMSLFCDVAPRLAVRNVTSPGFSPLQLERRLTSLTALFETFMEGHLPNHGGLTAASLRLLLHPLQCLSAHLHQCLATFGNIQDSRNSALGLASKAFIDELGALLERWRRLAWNLTKQSGNICEVTRNSLVLYHIMVLNNLSAFPEVERLARENQRGHAQTHTTRFWMRTSSADAVALLLFHCGQCLHHLRSMLPTTRPLWWAAALYRVTLVLSQATMSNAVTGFRFASSIEAGSSLIVLDKEYGLNDVDQDMALQRFLNRLQGTPALTKPDGSTVLLAVAVDVLDVSLAMLDEHLAFDSTAFANGVRVKIGALRWRWRESNSISMTRSLVG